MMLTTPRVCSQLGRNSWISAYASMAVVFANSSCVRTLELRTPSRRRRGSGAGLAPPASPGVRAGGGVAVGSLGGAGGGGAAGGGVGPMATVGTDDVPY